MLNDNKFDGSCRHLVYLTDTQICLSVLFFGMGTGEAPVHVATPTKSTL